MKYLFAVFLLSLHLFHLTWTYENNEAYCMHNKTITLKIKVNKTQEVIVSQPWYKKLSKPKVVIEQYEAEEIVPKIVQTLGCCEGYNMSGEHVCRPVCSEGCPENSECVEPEICKCIKGYFSTLSEHNRKHYCEPICKEPCPEHSTCVGPNECSCETGYKLTENKLCRPHCASGCPHGGSCIEPNHCQCAEGYQSEKGTCHPICSMGDGCKNGVCIGINECRCNSGYTLNTWSNTCEPHMAIFQEEGAVTTTDFGYDMETTTELPMDDHSYTFRVNEDYDESSTESDKASRSKNSKCPVDYVLYRGKCQPLKFALDEIDCRLEPCVDPNSHCTENGTCACNSGYRWFKKILQSDEDNENSKSPMVKAICITLEEYEAAVEKNNMEFNENGNADHSNSEREEEGESSGNLTSILFTVLGVLIMTSALVYLGFRLIRSGRSEADVEGKTMACAYDNRVITDAEKSVI